MKKKGLDVSATEKLDKQIQVIGKKFFVMHYDQLCSSATNNKDTARDLSNTYGYAFPACRVRVNKARQLLRKYDGQDLLRILLERSKSINADVRTQAEKLLDTGVKSTSSGIFEHNALVNNPPPPHPTAPRKKTTKKKVFHALLKHNSIKILPNLFTLMGLFFGFLSIVLSMRNRHIEAMYCIAIAGFFDGVDGKIARLTRSSSRFGIELDSIADMVSFGVAPAIFLLSAGFDSLGNIGWAVSFLYVVAAALRLARFNTLAGEAHAVGFTGLPSPAAAGVVVLTFTTLTYIGLPEQEIWRIIIVAIISVLVSLSMMSAIAYGDIKRIFSNLGSFWNSVIIAILLVLIIVEPFIFPCLILLVYWLFAPCMALTRFLRKRKIFFS